MWLAVVGSSLPPWAFSSQFGSGKCQIYLKMPKFTPKIPEKTPRIYMRFLSLSHWSKVFYKSYPQAIILICCCFEWRQGGVSYWIAVENGTFRYSYYLLFIIWNYTRSPISSYTKIYEIQVWMFESGHTLIETWFRNLERCIFFWWQKRKVLRFNG